MTLFTDLARLPGGYQTRTVSFENVTGAAGAGGGAYGGRKGSPSRSLAPGERVVLCDLEGPGRVGHIWLTVPPMRPEHLRAVLLEVFYDGATEPSVSAPVADFFGAPLGRPVPYDSALQSTQEGRGFNSWIPMPFRHQLRVELTNGAPRRVELYYQFDVTLGAVDEDDGLLHTSFRRENPTTLGRDFTIADGFVGPGRFLGVNVGIRVMREPEWFVWYGEGEVKMYLDDDRDLPTWCGTGLEDYVGSAWGMGAHQTAYQGVPLLVAEAETTRPMPDLVSFYRWHIPDPVVFEQRLRVTIQQIGLVMVPRGRQDVRDEIETSGRLAGRGWIDLDRRRVDGMALCERQDDYCATAFVYCRDVQPVPRVDLDVAIADVVRLPYEQPSELERRLG
jgi:hypothetical protein